MEQTRVINWDAINELAEEVFEQICDIFKIDTVCTYPDELKKKSLAYYLFPEYINEIAKTNLTNEEIIYEERATITIGRKVTPPVEGIYMYKYKIFNLLKTPIRNKKVFIG